ncbi:MAG: pyrroline-5-carboxylate reductase family protein, partial [Phycisphaerales bacterium JB039]
MRQLKQPVLFIGAGSMGSAILRGALEAGTLDARRLAVADPDADRRAGYANAFAASAEAIDWLIQHDPEDRGIIVLAIKPQSLRAVAREIRPQLEGSQRLVITILAGAPSETVRDVLGGTVRVIRVMPNLPAQVQRGISAIARGAGAGAGDESIAS